MNERIRELAEQALKHPDTDNDGLTVFDNDELKKFAELIVQECAGLFPNVYVEIETDYGHTPVIAADYIKKHFGIN
jgi:hypothetical protein